MFLSVLSMDRNGSMWVLVKMPVNMEAVGRSFLTSFRLRVSTGKGPWPQQLTMAIPRGEFKSGRTQRRCKLSERTSLTIKGLLALLEILPTSLHSRYVSKSYVDLYLRASALIGAPEGEAPK
jgi:hypothetical protein